jgi:methionyl-tRNA synthetase
VSTERIYLSTTLPYVNAAPHLGFALEAVQADVLARHHRLAGDQVRFQTGTDDNSLKTVLAAAAEGATTTELVRRNSAAFAGLREPLDLSTDDFIATSADPRHRPGVEKLWRACAGRGDLYPKDYQGLYCVGCEQFYLPGELAAGRCPEHAAVPQRVAERNWFFRLSRYAAPLRELIESGRLCIQPPERRREVLAFIAGGLEDFSVSRSRERAQGWGIPVPGDPSQVIYVWYDALGNYITAPGYGTDAGGYQRWWAGAGQRIHLAGKGVIRFHAVYWPAILLSAGEPLPTRILVHDYLTAGGRKISKSAPTAPGESVDPVALAAGYGTDAVRWWLLREVPRVGDADFTVARLVARANEDLANGVGNLVSRVVTLARKHPDGLVGDPASRPVTGFAEPGGEPVDGLAVSGDGRAGDGVLGQAGTLGGPDGTALRAACLTAAQRRAEALDAGDFRAAAAAVWAIAREANRYADRVRPWELARAALADGQGGLDAAWALTESLSLLLAACQALGRELEPFLPGLAARVRAACTPDEAGRLARPQPVFPRLECPKVGTTSPPSNG